MADRKIKWQDQYRDKLITAVQAAKLIKSGDKVVISLMAQPKMLGLALAQRKEELRGVTLMSNWTEDYPWFQAGWEESFSVQTGFGTRITREGQQQKRIDWLPAVFGLHDGVRYKAPMRDGVYHGADVFMCKVTPPNEDGWCSFGNHLWYSPTALATAKLVIVEVDETLPWTYGDNVHISEIDYLVESPPAKEPRKITDALPIPSAKDWEMSQVIGAHVASLIKDGDTIEIGTGTPTESVMSFLGDKNDLGVDAEMMYAQLIELIKGGVFTGKQKNVDQGKHVTTSLFLYADDPRNEAALSFIDRNPDCEFHDVSYMCNVRRIASINNMISINSVISIDLVGQANISHLGTVPITGPGGGVDYAIGAHYSKGGKAITCLLSTAKGGEVSRIVPRHQEGAVLLISSPYLDYLVTEHGMVNLDGKTGRQRAEAIISVADPKFQPWLKEEAKRMFWP